MRWCAPAERPFRRGNSEKPEGITPIKSRYSNSDFSGAFRYRAIIDSSGSDDPMADDQITLCSAASANISPS